MFALRQSVKNGGGSVRILSQSFHSSKIISNKQQPVTPMNDKRTSPKSTTGNHPGYTDASTPITDAHPENIPGAKENATPSSQVRFGSTTTAPEHPGVREMAEGAKIGGEGAYKPEDRNVKNWGPNQKTSQFNEHEGRRNPILHGGSHEGGHDSKGNSKT